MDLWIAVIGGLCTAIPTVIATVSANKKNTALITYRLEQLELRVKEHNNFGIRVQQAEDDIKYIKETIKELK